MFNLIAVHPTTGERIPLELSTQIEDRLTKLADFRANPHRFATHYRSSSRARKELEAKLGGPEWLFRQRAADRGAMNARTSTVPLTKDLPHQTRWRDRVGQRAPRSDSRPDGTDVDISTLDWWQPSKLRTDYRIVDAVLRHGVPSSRGIVVDGWPVVPLMRPARLAETLAEREASKEALRPTTDLVDRILGDGAVEERARIEAGVRASVEYALEEADEDIAEILATRRKPELVEHWRGLGGLVPSETARSPRVRPSLLDFESCVGDDGCAERSHPSSPTSA